MCFFFFFFNDTATTEIYTLSLHDALPICVFHDDGPNGRDGPGKLRAFPVHHPVGQQHAVDEPAHVAVRRGGAADRKSTRLNSSHANISYAVFCLKKKKITSLYK